MSGGVAEAGAEGVQAVVRTGQGGCGGSEYGILGGGTDRGRGRHTNLGEDNVKSLTLGTD